MARLASLWYLRGECKATRLVIGNGWIVPAFILGSQLLHRVTIVAYGRIEEDDSTYAISHANYRDSTSLCDRARISVKSEPDWSTQWQKKSLRNQLDLGYML
jgi:hypothetical protein